MNKDLNNYLLISLSLIFFILLDLISISQTVDQIKPSFFILSFIYWNVALPEKMNLYFAFTFGLLMDFMQGTVLGVYPLVLITLSYLSQRFFYQFRAFKFVQQGFIIFLIFLIFRFFTALDLNDSDPHSFSLVDTNYALLSFLFALLNSLFWVPLFYILRIYRRKWIGT